MTKYIKYYNELVYNCKQRNLNRESGYEIHHINPRCLGGGDESSNLVKFTLREHFIAHKLLTKIYPNNNSLLYAFNMLVNINGPVINISPKYYESARNFAINNFKDKVVVKDICGNTYKVDKDDDRYLSGEFISNAKHTVLCKHIDDNTDLIRLSKYDARYNTTYVPFFAGIPKSEEHRNKISSTRLMSGAAKGEKNPMFGNGYKVAGNKNGRYGKPTSDETKKKQSIKKKQFIEENGTESFGKGCIYIHDIKTKEIKRHNKELPIPDGFKKGYGKNNDKDIK